MPVEIIEAPTREDWLKARQQDVTASAVGAIFGEHEYISHRKLWRLKAGLDTEDPDETPAMRRGRLLEPVAVQMLREDFPDWEIEANTSYFRIPDRRAGATPDVRCFHPEKGPGIIQIKTVTPPIYRQKWQGGDRDAQPVPPFWITLQALLEMHLTGAKWAAVAPLRVGMGAEISLIDVPRHDAAVDAMLKKIDLFWKSIEEGKEPESDYALDVDLIHAGYAVPQGTIIDLTGNNAILALVDEDRDLQQQESVAVKRRKEIKAEIYDIVSKGEIITPGDDTGPTMVQYDGKPILKIAHIDRKGYTVEPSSYKRLTFI